MIPYEQQHRQVLYCVLSLAQQMQQLVAAVDEKNESTNSIPYSEKANVKLLISNVISTINVKN